MHKQLISVIAAMAAFMALAVVPSASAIELTNSSGKTADTFIRAHNVGNTILTTAAGNVVCTTASMTVHLTQNGPTVIAGDIQAASFKGTETEQRCAWNPGLGATKVTVTSLPWCMRSLEGTDTFEVRGGTCLEATRPLTFVLDVGPITCAYQRNNVIGTFTTSPSEAILTVSEVEFAKHAGSFLCPGSTKFDASFTLENDTGETDPLYIDK